MPTTGRYITRDPIKARQLAEAYMAQYPSYLVVPNQQPFGHFQLILYGPRGEDMGALTMAQVHITCPEKV